MEVFRVYPTRTASLLAQYEGMKGRETGTGTLTGTLFDVVERVLDASLTPLIRISHTARLYTTVALMDRAGVMATPLIAEREKVGYARGVLEIFNDFQQNRMSPQEVHSLTKRVQQEGQRFHRLYRTFSQIAQLYEDYDQVLQRKGWMDDVGALQEATAALQQGVFSPFSSIALCGFYTFTPAQGDFLAALQASGCEVRYEKPPYAPSPDREPTLYSILQPFLVGGGERVEPERAQTPGPLDSAFFLCPTLPDEIRIASQKMKQLLLKTDARPEDCLLVFRTFESDILSLSAEDVLHALSVYGLPITSAVPSTLLQSPFIHFLLTLLKLKKENYPRKSFISLLWNPYIKGLVGEISPRTIQQVDEGSLAHSPGKPEIPTARVRRVMGGEEEWKGLLKDMDLLDRFSPLFSSLHPFQEDNTFAVFAGNLQAVLRRFSLPLSSDDQKARELFLRELAVVGESLGSIKISLDAFLETVETLCRHTHWMPGKFNPASVILCTAMEALGVRRPFLFLCNLTEKGFPLSAPEVPILSWTAREVLNHLAGKPIFLTREVHQETERVLFRACVTSATHRVLFFSHYLEGEEPVQPSPFLSTYAPSSLTYNEKQKTYSIREVLQPEPEDVYHPEECARALLSRRISASQLSGFLGAYAPPSRCARLEGALRAEQLRWSEAYSPYDGVLTDPSLLSHLALRGKDREHHLSPTALESYGKCPYQYFADKVLRLKKYEEPEEDISPMDAGDVLHRILQKTFEKLKPFEVNLTKEKLLGAGMQASEEIFMEIQQSSPSLPPLWSIFQFRVLLLLQRYLPAEFFRLQEWRLQPIALEQWLEGYVIKGQEPDVFLLGKTDRVDLRDNQLFITDYKTGGLSTHAFVDYRNLQLALYLLLAVEKWGKPAGGGAYVSLTKPGTTVPGMPPENVARDLMDAQELTHFYVSGIRRGMFPPLPGNHKEEKEVILKKESSPGGDCSYCPYLSLCRIASLQGSRKINPLRFGDLRI